MIQVTGFNYDTFDSTTDVNAKTCPPNGNYVLAIIGGEKKISQAGYELAIIYFEVASGERSKEQFEIMYYIGNPIKEQQVWAHQGLGRLSYGVSGVKPTERSGFVLEPLMFKSFNATLFSKDGKHPKLTAMSPYTNAQPMPSSTAPAWGAPQQ